MVQSIGIERKGLVETEPSGYIAAFLDGIWLRAPYLHNGSVPTLRDLLKPAAERPKVFYRGYDVYDPVDVGFVTQGSRSATGRHQIRRQRAGQRQPGPRIRHESVGKEKDALIEYLKTL